MRVAIVHDRLALDATPDERDALVQAEAVRAALADLGHEVQLLPLTLDLARVRHQLADAGAELVFNLVESVEGRGALIHLAPALYGSIPIRFTGSGVRAVFETSSKLIAKQRLAEAGLPTPGWLERSSHPDAAPEPGRYVWKAVWEHASRGLDDASVVKLTADSDWRSGLAAAERRLGVEAFGERFIEGREFNLAILERPDGTPEVLPAAEMQFIDWPAERPTLVGYAAKWDEASFEYSHTVRRFDLPARDGRLLEQLRALARDCWKLFGLRGYARVDFRVDNQGSPWILEINVNPCLSPGAGFSAALDHAGISFRAAVERIVHAAGTQSPHPTRVHPRPIPPQPEVLVFRREVRPEDPRRIREITGSTGFFSAAELDVAEELALERLARGPASGYHFVFAESQGRVIGYTCYGPIACTQCSFDLYWIVVAGAERSRGIGRMLLAETEHLIVAQGGTRLYAETSSRDQYLPTRKYYLGAGFTEEARVGDFYGTDDSKVIYAKALTPH